MSQGSGLASEGSGWLAWNALAPAVAGYGRAQHRLELPASVACWVDGMS